MQNYEANISQHPDCNNDPFGQNVEWVPKSNILKNGNDPTVNKGDQAMTNHSELARKDETFSKEL